MCSQLDALISHFEKYFSEDMEKHNWIRNPFVDNANASQEFTSLEAEQFNRSFFWPHFEKFIQP